MNKNSISSLRLKNLFLIIIIIFCSQLYACGFETVSEHDSKVSDESALLSEQVSKYNNSEDIDQGYIQVVLTISCKGVLNNEKLTSKVDIPSNEIFYSSPVIIKEGSSVMDLLRQVSADASFTYSLTGTTYVNEIFGLKEKECGTFSGWMFKINDVSASCSADKYILKDSDTIEWYYTY